MTLDDLGITPGDLGITLEDIIGPNDLGVTLDDLNLNFADLGINFGALGITLDDLGLTLNDLGLTLDDLGITPEDLGLTIGDLTTDGTIDLNSVAIDLSALNNLSVDVLGSVSFPISSIILDLDSIISGLDGFIFTPDVVNAVNSGFHGYITDFGRVNPFFNNVRSFFKGLFSPFGDGGGDGEGGPEEPECENPPCDEEGLPSVSLNAVDSPIKFGDTAEFTVTVTDSILADDLSVGYRCSVDAGGLVASDFLGDHAVTVTGDTDAGSSGTFTIPTESLDLNRDARVTCELTDDSLIYNISKRFAFVMVSDSDADDGFGTDDEKYDLLLPTVSIVAYTGEVTMLRLLSGLLSVIRRFVLELFLMRFPHLTH